ncbi:MAG: HD domain-containing protein [candidate division WOR-3 bacterium]
MKTQFLKAIKPGTQVDDVFFCTRRDVKERRDGAPFLTFEFQDKSGRVAAIMWDRIDDALRCVEPGGFYRVVGKMGDYQGKPQLTVSVIYPADPAQVNREDFISATKYDRKQLLAELRKYIAAVKNRHLAGLLATFFEDDEFVRKFSDSPAAAQVHHACIGGLLEHTVFMCRLARTVPDTYEEVDRDLLMTGIILHDVGKTEEYVYDKAIDHTWDGRLIGHIVMGYDLVCKRIDSIKEFPEELRRLILHIILAHHGQLEFGSPKSPKFVEALIVHFLDNLDARIAMFRDAVADNQGTKWTEFHKYLETNIYIRDPLE